MMNIHPRRSRPPTRRSRQAYRPAVLGLEQRTMMASGLADVSAQATRSAERVATSVILGEVTTFLAGQPLPVSLLARLNRGINQGSLTREGALRRVLRTPQVEAGLVRGLTEDLLNREPTPAESRALVAALQTRGADIPWTLLQVMTR